MYDSAILLFMNSVPLHRYFTVPGTPLEAGYLCTFIWAIFSQFLTSRTPLVPTPRSRVPAHYQILLKEISFARNSVSFTKWHLKKCFTYLKI